MGKQGREPDYEACLAPLDAGGFSDCDRTSPQRCPSRYDRINGLRTRIQAGDYDVPAILVAESIIAQMMGLPRETPYALTSADPIDSLDAP